MYSNFKKLNVKSYQKPGTQLTEDNVYWKQFGSPRLIKEFAPIDYVHFSPIQPYHFAVTCSIRIQIYNPITKLVYKNLSHFKENAYGACFRSDGRLLCCGGEETNVKLFDVATRRLQRLFKGHKAPVHRTYFLNEKPQIVSFSDDKCVKLWDIPTEKELSSFCEHTDYVRAGATCSAIQDIVLSGGYDNMVNMYDTRSNQVVFKVNHGSPVEALQFLPSGGVFFSAGGTEIKIWDAVAGGKQLGSMSQHHKTITSMCLASDNKRLLSASLDRQVKVYNINTFEVVHSMEYPNGILSVGVSRNDDTIVTGLLDGLVCVSRKSEEKQIAQESTTKKKKRENKVYVPLHTQTVDLEVKEEEKEKWSKINTCLRKFQWSKVFDIALLPYISRKHPEITISALEELIKRRMLDVAMAGREEKSILPLVRFLQRTITDQRFSRAAIDILSIFLDVYSNELQSMSPEIINAVKLLSNEVQAMETLLEGMTKTEGILSMLFTHASNTNEEIMSQDRSLTNLNPSSSATESFVVKIK